MGGQESCGGYDIQALGTEEVFKEHVAKHGPIWCNVHKCDAWLCFAGADKCPYPVDETTTGGSDD